MTHAGWIAATCACLLAILPAVAMAETEHLRATAETPAILTVRPERGIAADGSSRKAKLVISVTNYRPADDCTPVEIVVDGSKGDGVVHEIGRFGITPATNFDAPDPSQALRFNLPLPDELIEPPSNHRVNSNISEALAICPIQQRPWLSFKVSEVGYY